MCRFEAVHALGMLAAVTTPLPPFLFPSNQCNPPKGGKSEECSSTAAFLLPPVPSAGSSLPAKSCFVLEKTPPQCMGACSCPTFAALLVRVLSKSEHLARVFKYLHKAIVHNWARHAVCRAAASVQGLRECWTQQPVAVLSIFPMRCLPCGAGLSLQYEFQTAQALCK